jgi:hypothetical protein
MRTTSGPTFGNEVVPRSLRPASGCPPASVVTTRSSVASIPFLLRDFGLARGTVRDTGGALCRPLSGVAGAVGGGNHGVSDPAARARRGPAPVRRGRSRHGCHCRFRLSSTACWQQKARRVFRTERARLRLGSSGGSGPVCPENVSAKQVTFARACRPVAVLENGGLWALHSMSSCGRREGIAFAITPTPSAITTTMLHLCSAPCKALRFASPAPARPSGLDGACAQMIGRALT